MPAAILIVSTLSGMVCAILGAGFIVTSWHETQGLKIVGVGVGLVLVWSAGCCFSVCRRLLRSLDDK